MKKNIFNITAVLGLVMVLLHSCGPKDNPPLVYFPDMYYPVAYDPLMKAQDAYSTHDNEIPLFVARNGATGLGPVDGTVSQNTDGVIEENSSKALTPNDYNAGYDASKAITNSPLDPKNVAKDLERGKILYNQTCAACHGENGDGQGPIVQSGAYSGVPKYADRQVTVGSVHYVLENGRNAMGSFAGQLKPGDRWRVSMYVMSAFKASTPAVETATEKNATEPAASAVTTSVSNAPKK